MFCSPFNTDISLAILVILSIWPDQFSSSSIKTPKDFAECILFNKVIFIMFIYTLKDSIFLRFAREPIIPWPVAAEPDGPRGLVAHPLFAFFFFFARHHRGRACRRTTPTCIKYKCRKHLKSEKKMCRSPPPPPPAHQLFQTWPTHFQNRSAAPDHDTGADFLYIYFFFLLVSSAVGHRHDNTPMIFFWKFFEVGKINVSESPPPPPHLFTLWIVSSI